MKVFHLLTILTMLAFACENKVKVSVVKKGASAPTGRWYHTAVWSGSKMIVWGGFNAGNRNDGGVYDATANSWTATNSTNAPAG